MRYENTNQPFSTTGRLTDTTTDGGGICCTIGCDVGFDVGFGGGCAGGCAVGCAGGCEGNDGVRTTIDSVTTGEA